MHVALHDFHNRILVLLGDDAAAKTLKRQAFNSFDTSTRI
jgi:hypothetical protein